MTYVYITIGILFVVLIAAMCYAIKHEEEVLEKAEKTNNMLNFYHVLALLTSSKYKNYKPTDKEKEAMAKYLYDNANAVHDNHPISGYFRLCKENEDVCKTAGNFHNDSLEFNGSELGVGLAVMVAFFIGLFFVVL